MSTTDLANYGTVLSYAVDTEDNEVTFTDYGGFVLSIKGIISVCKIYYILVWFEKKCILILIRLTTGTVLAIFEK